MARAQVFFYELKYSDLKAIAKDPNKDINQRIQALELIKEMEELYVPVFGVTAKIE